MIMVSKLFIISDLIEFSCYFLWTLHLKKIWGDERNSVFFLPLLFLRRKGKHKFKTSLVLFLFWIYWGFVYAYSQLYIFDRNPRTGTLFALVVTLTEGAIVYFMVKDLIGKKTFLNVFAALFIVLIFSGAILNFALKSSRPSGIADFFAGIIFLSFAILGVSLILRNRHAIHLEIIVVIFAFIAYHLSLFFEISSFVAFLSQKGYYMFFKRILMNTFLIGSLIWIPKLKAKYEL